MIEKSCTLKIRGGVRERLLRQTSRERGAHTMGEERNAGREPRPDFVCVVLEHHPNDSRLKIKDDGICQTLNSRMGTGGGNVPLILIYENVHGKEIF